MNDPRDPIPVPKFLVELEPRMAAFFGNLSDLVFPHRLPPLQLTSRPAAFWPDVIINDRFPVRGLFDSVAGHVLVVTAVYALAYFGFFGSHPQQIRHPLHNTISYYSVADFLPEVNSGSRPSKVELKGQPAYAKQEIISVPPEPDNTRQTIITPWEMKLKHDIPLPNIVAWNPNLPAAPLSATPGRTIKLALQPEVVAPAPEPVTREGALRMPTDLMHVTAVPPPVDPLTSARRTPSQLQPDVAAPAVDPLVASKPDSIKLHNDPSVVGPAAEIGVKHAVAARLATPSVVEPAADPNQARRQIGSMNIARLGPAISAPKLSVAEQQALGTGEARGGGRAATGARGSNGANTPVAAGQQSGPPAAAPSIEGLGNGRSSGQLIALSVEPTEVKGPIEVPAGSRRGVFAAGPKGISGAPGTPDLHKGADGAGGTSTTNGIAPGGGNHTAPEGIYVGPGNTHVPVGAVVANNPGPLSGKPEPSFRDKLMAAARAPDIARQPAPGNAVAQGDRKIEEKVFGSKRYYSMTLNMPNLSSSTGSWIIRFAELKQSHDDVAVAAPAVLSKVDPAYPAELIRDKVEGTVVLYAVIHSDGSIGEIRVLSGVEDRLDQSAAKALARWRFHPGTKNGQPIDLEAVVQIPFHVRKLLF